MQTCNSSACFRLTAPLTLRGGPDILRVPDYRLDERHFVMLQGFMKNPFVEDEKELRKDYKIMKRTPILLFILIFLPFF